MALMAGSSPAVAQASDLSGAQRFHVEPGPLADALRTVSLLSGVPVIFSESVVRERSTYGVSGNLGIEAALDALLAGSGLEAVPAAGGYVIRVEVEPVEAPAVARSERSRQPEEVPQPLASGTTDQEADLRINRVTVTGTSLRGFAPESSPLDVYLREDIASSGVTTTQQFIRTLPQNFSGGSSELIRSLPNDAATSSNTTAGTGANLRGLGAGSTLTLLNGRRLAPSSAIGDFVDLSLIPLSALSRVEVLTDGASSIYGGDAVAGVVNFVMRDDFSGSETGVRYGRVTDGDLEEVRFAQTAGTSWGSGNILGTYEYHTRDALRLRDRPAILPYSQGQGGAIRTDFFDLSPQQTRHSAVISGGQRLTDRFSVSGLGLYSERSGSSVTIATSGTVRDADQQSKVLSLGFGAELELTPSFDIILDGTYSEVKERNLSAFFTLTSPSITLSELETRSELWSADGRLTGDLFALPGGQVRGALGASFRREDFLSGIRNSVGSRAGTREIRSVYAEVHVPLFGADNARPGLRRLELNLSGRVDDYSDFGTTSNPKAGVLWSPLNDLQFRSSYSTSFSPPTLGRIGALDRTGVVQRYGEVLRQFGASASDPSLLDMNILRTFGTASGELGPETSTAFTVGTDYDLTRNGQSWTAALTYYDIVYEGRLGRTPVPGSPPTTNLAPNIAFSDPAGFPAGAVIFNPTQQQVMAALSTFSVPPIYLNGLTAADTISIINNVDLIRNLAETTTRGLDARLGVSGDTLAGKVTAGLNVSYIFEFNRRAAVTSPVVEELNTLYNPVDLQAGGRLGLARGGFAGNLSLQYKDSYRTDGSPAALPVGSWTTLDLSLSYDFDRPGGWLQDVRAGVSVLNLFDRMPPRTPAFGNFNLPGYDPTNASPLGRFVAVDISKSF